MAEADAALEARYAPGRSFLFFGLGVVALLMNGGLYLFAGYHYPILWAVGPVLVVLGLRGMDRRVKLRVGPEGLWYAPWGSQVVPWGEFDGFSWFEAGKLRIVGAAVKYPDQFRTRLSWSARLDSHLNPRLGRPAFYINPSQLDVDGARLVAALRVHVPG